MRMSGRLTPGLALALVVAAAAMAAMPTVVGLATEPSGAGLTDASKAGTGVTVPDLDLTPGQRDVPRSPIDPPTEQQPPEDGPGDFADSVGRALAQEWAVASVAGVLVAAIALGAFAMVTRYVSPKEALENPQRSMLYGYVRGHPGVHLKQLSDEFKLKTSSILWHMRKLECAELVRTERANGFRVFYPTAGGIDAKNVSRGVAAIQNANALAIFDAVERAPGTTVAALSDQLGLHGGTVRWHLRKLVEYGLLEDLPAGLFATPVGRKSAEAVRAGRGVPAVPAAPSAPMPAARPALD